MANVKPNVPALDIASLHEADLRRHPRQLCVDGSVLRLAVRPEFRGRRAVLIDVSAGGIGFLLKDPLEADTMLAFELQGAGDFGPITRVARVRHSRPHPTPANAPWLPPTPVFSRFFRGLFGQPTPPAIGLAWLIGCQWDKPMSDAEIAILLDQLTPSASDSEA